MQQFYYRELLLQTEWKEGKLVEDFATSSYRQRTTIVCSSHGRTRGEFANGEFPYFAYFELVDAKGQWIKQGNNIVPVLPDGRLLMVIEQRLILDRYPMVVVQKDGAVLQWERPTQVKLDGGRVIELGRYGSLEFPGGAINPGESVTSGSLRELAEESDIPEQTGTLYRRIPPVYPFGSDLALQMFISVLYLSNLKFPDKVENDGGLGIVALTFGEVEQNIKNGVIASGQAALLGWGFYGEVDLARFTDEESELFVSGYAVREEVRIVKPK